MMHVYYPAFCIALHPDHLKMYHFWSCYNILLENFCIINIMIYGNLDYFPLFDNKLQTIHLFPWISSVRIMATHYTVLLLMHLSC